MANEGKVLLGIAGLGILGWLLFKKKPAPTDVIPSGVINWNGGAAGAYAGYAGIASAVEGSTNSAIVTVTNASRLSSGASCSYKFVVGINIVDDFGTIVAWAFANKITIRLDAEATGSVTVPVSIPVGYFGSMTAQALLLTEDETKIVAESTLLAVTVSEAAPVAGLSLSDKHISTNLTGDWLLFTSGMSIALPTGNYYFNAYWINNLTASVKGYIVVSVETPDGKRTFLAAYTGQGTSLAPGGYTYVAFTGPAMTVRGTYRFTVSLCTLSGSTYTLRNRAKLNLIVT